MQFCTNVSFFFNRDKSLVDIGKLEIGKIVLVRFEATGQNVYHYVAKVPKKIVIVY